VTNEEIMKRDNFICQACKKYIGYTGCISHRIANTKVNKKKYGKEIIDHDYNKAYTCISNICNDGYNIGMNPEKCQKLVHLIWTRSEEKLSAKYITNYLEG
jgi:hypothetical protein